MVIAQNIPSLRAHLNMLRTNRGLAAATGRLSSGYRINSAKDDPTGMAISNKLSYQLSGIEKATDNASNGVALIQTAEGALSEIHNMLQRMRELAVQAANDTNEAEDREKIQIEIDELVAEIQSTANKTEYNKIKVLNGEGSRITESWEVGPAEKDTSIASILYVSEDVQPGSMTYTIDEVGLPAVQQIDPITAANVALYDSCSKDAVIIINGIELNTGDSKDFNSLQTNLVETLGLAGIELHGTTGQRYLMTTVAGSNQEIEIKGDETVLECLGLRPTPTPITGTDAKISGIVLSDVNTQPLANEQSGLSYSSSGNHITIKGTHGEDIRINLAVKSGLDGGLPQFTLPDDTVAADIAGFDADGKPVPLAVEFFPDDGNKKDMEVKFKDYGPIKIQVGGSYNDNVSVYIPKLTSETLGLIEFKSGVKYDLLNYRTQKTATIAINQCEEALALVSHVRSRLGAFNNRLESTVRALEVAGENTNSSRSRIKDTDMAKEMTEYASQNVMYQAGIAIMTQSNQRPQQILSMLNK